MITESNINAISDLLANDVEDDSDSPKNTGLSKEQLSKIKKSWYALNAKDRHDKSMKKSEMDKWVKSKLESKNPVRELQALIEDGKQIASDILKQLGGNKFIVMTGAKNLAYGDKGLSFKIGKNSGGITHVKINLNGKDLYDMEFLKIRGTDMKTIKVYNDVYNDGIQQIFTDVTGMNTSLGTMGK